MTTTISPLPPSEGATAPVQTEAVVDVTTAPIPAPTSKFEEDLNKLLEETVHNKVECIDIKVYAEYAEAEVSKGVFKKITHADLKRIMGNINAQEAEVQIRGILPPSNLIFMSQTAKEMRLSCYYPGGIRKMKYGDSELEIIAPNIIISHTLRMDNKDWVVASSYYFCTDLPVSKLPKTFISSVNNSNRIWLLPMSNTYDQGNMCYGNNSMPARGKDDNLRFLDYYYSYLWDTPFNNDLGIKAVGTSNVGGWYRALKAVAAAKKPFPYHKLRGWTKGDYSAEFEMESIGDY